MLARQWHLLCSLLLASHLTFSSTARQRRSRKRHRTCLHLPLLITLMGTGKRRNKIMVMERPRTTEDMARRSKPPWVEACFQMHWRQSLMSKRCGKLNFTYIVYSDGLKN